MKPPRLSRAQWELLRKLPDDSGVALRGNPLQTGKALKARGFAHGQWNSLVSDWRWWRTQAGRALIEAEDKRLTEEAERVAEEDRRNFEQTALAGSWEID